MDEYQEQLRLDLPRAAGTAGLAGDQDVADVIAELVEAVSDDQDLSAFGADCRAAWIAASFRLAIDDPSLIGGTGSGLPGSMATVSGAEVERSPVSIVDGQ